MLSEVVIRQRNKSRCMSNINKAVSTSSKGAMINPNIGGCKNTNPISIAPKPMSNMLCGATNQSWLPWLTIMNTNPMNNDIFNPFQSNAWSIGNLNFNSPPINSLVAIHNELILKFKHHASLKNDPKGLGLYYSVTKCPGFWINGIVRWVIHHVYVPIFTP